ncbi:hypothetical protein PG999_000612 [Apiospora kogelbergensis]|uniref:Uncharacterized protein n=1 Tax=Apiospora kogelbergensis TaxID=1337665 RepID=A0AAW0RCG4_9PEZI
MKGRPIDQLVYEYMFSKPKASDPQDFHALLHRYLILEVRQEVHSFYGHLDTQEAKYPGLDYCNRIHRIRLSRWPWHRRLFRAFDGLRLTHSEISNLTKWEGTKWAKERFERDSGITIKDTADECMSTWVPPEERSAAAATSPSEDETEVVQPEGGDTTENADDDMEGEEDSDGEMESIGIALNQRLLERTARREAGADTSEPLDEEWEQWLKNAIDSGELPFLSGQTIRESPTLARHPQLVPMSHYLTAARAGQWNAVPTAFRELLRRTLASEGLATGDRAMPPLESASLRSPSLQTVQWRRTVSNLRLPVSEGSSSSNTGSGTVRLNRTAQSNA